MEEVGEKLKGTDLNLGQFQVENVLDDELAIGDFELFEIGQIAREVVHIEFGEVEVKGVEALEIAGNFHFVIEVLNQRLGGEIVGNCDTREFSL